jgi:hypothetical protein
MLQSDDIEICLNPAPIVSSECWCVFVAATSRAVASSRGRVSAYVLLLVSAIPSMLRLRHVRVIGRQFQGESTANREASEELNG